MLKYKQIIIEYENSINRSAVIENLSFPYYRVVAVPTASLTLKIYFKRFITFCIRQSVLRHWQQCSLRHDQLQSADSKAIKKNKSANLFK